MKTYLITGATGLIGQNLVKELLPQGCRLVLPVRNIEKAQAMFGVGEQLCYVQHDFEKALPLQVEEQVDYIIHAACPTASSFMQHHPVETINTILNGTQSILELARKQQVESVVFLSSLEVYGNITDDSVPVTEDVQGYVDPLSPRSSYPMGKRMAEALCADYAAEYGVPVKIARLTQTFGPGVSATDRRVFAQFAASAREGRDIVLATTGASSRMYLHTQDAVSAILTILEKGENGQAYNVANEDTYISVLEMAQFVKENFNPAIQVRVELQQNHCYLPEFHLRLSTEKLKALGWKAQNGLYEMFKALNIS